MRKMSLGWALLPAMMALVVISTPASANCSDKNGTGNGKDVGNGCKDPINVSATPELDSAILFAGGAVSLGGYALLRLRARRRDQQ